MPAGQAGLDFKGLSPMRDGLLHLPAQQQQIAQVVVGARKPRVNRQRPIILGHGVVPAPQLAQGLSQVVMGQPVVLCHGDSLTKKTLAVLPVTQLGAGPNRAAKQGAPGENATKHWPGYLAPARPLALQRRFAVCATLLPAPEDLAHFPDQHDEQADQRQVGIAISHLLQADLH